MMSGKMQSKNQKLSHYLYKRIGFHEKDVIFLFSRLRKKTVCRAAFPAAFSVLVRDQKKMSLVNCRTDMDTVSAERNRIRKIRSPVRCTESPYPARRCARCFFFRSGCSGLKKPFCRSILFFSAKSFLKNIIYTSARYFP